MRNEPWYSFYEHEVQPQLDYPTKPLTALLNEAAEKYPSHVAIYFIGKKMTYRKLREDAYRFANALRSLGVGKGDRVALMLPNCPQYVIGYYGALYVGAVIVQTNPLYVESELERHLNDSGAKAIVCLDLVYPRLRAVRDKVTTLQHVVVTSIKDFLPFPKSMLYPLVQKRKGVPLPKLDPARDRVQLFAGLLSASPSTPVETAVDPVRDVAVLQYTGGTTGTSKGAMLTHFNLIANALQCRAWMHRMKEGKESLLAAVPLFHVYGMTVCMNLGVLAGARLVLLPRFEIDPLLDLIHTQEPTLFPGAPTMYIAIINHPNIGRYKLSSIQCCISGSAPLPQSVQTKFEELSGGRLVEGFGLTEASPVTHANPIWGNRKTGSIGLPWPDTMCKIVETATGKELPPGEVGELIVKGPQVMQGYWNNPEETAAVLKDGWLYTSDLGYMDEEGYFYIVDRKKDMINAGGLKVYPREVEEVLFGHPGVQEAAVIGVPDPYRGETVKAFIVSKKGAELSESELDAFCRSRLAAYKIPRVYEFRQELPKTFVGKVLRRLLVDEERKRSSSDDSDGGERREAELAANRDSQEAERTGMKGEGEEQE
ncbi:AMP-binding protein [Paenibacillus sp. MBLB4367]|uniref:AMP-binding protein n=1 Tax=Paenibacillus sp. MBLB4367 TaxID=3384767 RepID=UPI003907ED66